MQNDDRGGKVDEVLDEGQKALIKELVRELNKEFLNETTVIGGLCFVSGVFFVFHGRPGLSLMCFIASYAFLVRAYRTKNRR